MSIPNNKNHDPFSDATKGDEDGVQDGLVHIRIQQRCGRKTITTVQGLSKGLSKKIVRSCKKVKYGAIISSNLTLNLLSSQGSLLLSFSFIIIIILGLEASNGVLELMFSF